MPPDPVSPGDERVTLWRCSDGHVHNWFTVVGGRKFCVQPGCINPDDPVQFIRASVVDDLRSRLEGVEAERDAAHHSLRQCIRLTGVDLSDGFPTQPPLHEFAVDAVHEMRKDYDECPAPEDVQAVQARLSRADEALREAYRELSNMHPPSNPGQDKHNLRWARQALETLREALASHPEEPKA